MKQNKPNSAGKTMTYTSNVSHAYWRRLLIALASLLLMCGSLIANAQAASLSATPDRYEMFENETLVLTVKYENGQSSSTPDFSPLKQSFDILGQNQSSQYVNTNGRISSSVQWVLTLAPKTKGKLLIPPLSLDGERSSPATVHVKTAASQPKGSEVVFIETSVDKQSVYVQEEFIVSLKLHFRENIIDANAEDFVVPNAEIVELNRSQYQTTLVHTPYQVIHLRFAVKPQASGTLEIPSFLWTLRTSASTSRFAASRSTMHRLRTDAMNIEVKPKPANYPAGKPWLPAKALNISESWSQNPPQFTEGEPITRNITITARGLSGEQLPPLTLDDGQGAFKYSPDQPQINSDNDDRGTTGSRQESYALVPNRAGSLTLPAVEVTWWDTTADQLRTSTIPAKTIEVAAAAGTSATDNQPKTAVLPKSFGDKPKAQSNTVGANATVEYVDNPLWKWLAIASLLLNLALITVLAALWLKNKKPPTVNSLAPTYEPNNLKAAIKAAKSHQAEDTYAELQRWLKTRQVSSHLVTGFRTLGANDSLLTELSSLDRSLFSANADAGAWPGNALAAELEAFKPKASSNGREFSLYPSAA